MDTREFLMHSALMMNNLYDGNISEDSELSGEEEEPAASEVIF